MILAVKGSGDPTIILIIVVIVAVYCFLWWIYLRGKKEGIRKTIEENNARYSMIKSREETFNQRANEAKSRFDEYQARRKNEFDEYQKKLKNEIEMYKNNSKKEFDEYKKSEVEKKKLEIDSYFNKKNEFHLIAKNEFESGFFNGRKWLVKYFSELEKINDDYIDGYLRNKARPAKSAADILKKTNQEKREIIQKMKFLECQLDTYKEYFPFLEEYEEYILNDEIKGSSLDVIESETEQLDRVRLFLTDEEYKSLTTPEKNQLALDRYIKRDKSKWEIGRHYERYIGYLYELDKWDVFFSGAIKGLEDMGRDLICKKDNLIHIVQAKCWSKAKKIHEKHIFQLFGTSLLYEMENQNKCSVTPVFVTTTILSDVAKFAATRLGIDTKNIELSMDYPMIKCNISTKNNERIYHLPFDQQYDKTKIDRHGECYVKTVREAEERGFRRARKYLPT
jgi:hypothetical protein